MNLYKLETYKGKEHQDSVYIIASSEVKAHNLLYEKLGDQRYFQGTYVQGIDLIAQEGKAIGFFPLIIEDKNHE